jgi:D-aminopeptidase
MINGAPVGRELGQYYLKDQPGLTNPPGDGKTKAQSSNTSEADGSIIMVIATDAPIDARNLGRMAARAMMGLARTGSAGTNGSGDYAIAFSTSMEVRIRTAASPVNRNVARNLKSLPNDAVSPLFLAVIEATEEAIYNSLFRAHTITGQGRTVEALPLERTFEILRKYRAIKK